MKKTLLTLLFASIFSTTFAQGFAYYPFNSVLSVSTNPTKKVWFDTRFQTNSYFSALSTELSPMVNINDNPLGRFYVGTGVRFNFIALVNDYRAKTLEGYFLNAGVRSEPFPKLPHLQIAFEISPYVQRDAEIGLFRSFLGLSYYFKK